MLRSWKKRRRQRKAREKIKAAVYAFIYLNRALIRANISRQVRRQLKRDLMTRDDPEGILLVFLKKIQDAANVPKGQKAARTGDLPRSPKGTFKTDGDKVTSVSSHME